MTMFALLFVLLSLSAAAEGFRCNRIISAFSLRSIDYLVTSEGVRVIDNIARMEDRFAPQLFPMIINGQTAAVAYNVLADGVGQYILFSRSVPQGHQVFDTRDGLQSVHPLGDLSDVNVDAAAVCGDSIFAFSGDEYLTITPGSGETGRQPLSGLGLPNNVDAAWSHGDLVLVVKGADFYFAMSNACHESFAGPFAFRDVYRHLDFDINLLAC